MMVSDFVGQMGGGSELEVMELGFAMAPEVPQPCLSGKKM